MFRSLRRKTARAAAKLTEFCKQLDHYTLTNYNKQPDIAKFQIVWAFSKTQLVSEKALIA